MKHSHLSNPVCFVCVCVWQNDQLLLFTTSYSSK